MQSDLTPPLVILVALASSASAGETMKHSGSIVAVADDATTFVLAEVGPWQMHDGATAITYRTITVTPETIAYGPFLLTYLPARLVSPGYRLF